ncbi:MAG: sulfite exporter TauE/SafE family protein [Chloroflexota bacterium]
MDHPETLAFLYVAGVLGGIVSVIVSLASLVTYPALLAVGLAPVAANVTNTVALTFTAAGAAIGSRGELRGQRPTVLRLALVAAAGGATGGALLLVLPGRTFELLAPVLVFGASVVLLVQPSFSSRPLFRPVGFRPGPLLGYYCATIYSGYFGAAGGIIALVVLGAIIARPLVEVNAAKNVLAGVANGVAAIAFAFFGPVAWIHAVPLALGVFTGGLIGPSIARRIPAAALRLLVGCAGIVVAGMLAWRTYGPA